MKSTDLWASAPSFAPGLGGIRSTSLAKSGSECRSAALLG